RARAAPPLARQGPGSAPVVGAAWHRARGGAALPAALPRAARSRVPSLRAAGPCAPGGAQSRAPRGPRAQARRPGERGVSGTLLIRAPNWVGDLVMATPVLEAALA